MRLKLKKCLPPGSKAGRKFNTIYLNDRALKSTFKLTLSNRFQALENCEDDPMETLWETTKQAWKSTCEEVLGKRSRTQKEWLTADTMRVVDKRGEKKAELNIVIVIVIVIEHFQDLLDRPVPPNPTDIPPAHRTLNVKVHPPSKAEIERAVKKLKANRAAGPDEIPPRP